MNHIYLTILVLLALLLLFLFIVYKEDFDASRKINVSRAVPKALKPVTQLELMYPSILKDETLHVPVKSIFHAQELVDVMGLESANVGYRRSADGASIVLYGLDSRRVLRRISELV